MPKTNKSTSTKSMSMPTLNLNIVDSTKSYGCKAMSIDCIEPSDTVKFAGETSVADNQSLENEILNYINPAN